MAVSNVKLSLYKKRVHDLSLLTGKLNSLQTTDKSSIVNAINEINTSTANFLPLTGGTMTGNIAINDATITSDDLLTTATDVEGAINELNAEIGDIATLTTTSTTDVVTALNSIMRVFQKISCESNIPASYSAAVCCGNSIKQGVESCDDGNQAGGDDCSANCKKETINLQIMPVANGIAFIGDASASTGHSVGNIGDFNGDTQSDIIISAHEANSQSGAAYIIYGKKGRFNSDITLSTLNGKDGVIVNGPSGTQGSGYSVSGAGDINNDGFYDILMGDLAGSNIYLVYGKKGGIVSPFDLTTLELAVVVNENEINLADGVLFTSGGDGIGKSVSDAGDFNGDNIDDFLIGYPGNSGDDGIAYLIFGKASGFVSPFNLSTMTPSDGIIFTTTGGSAAHLGFVLGKANDVNGDGIDDIYITAYSANSGAGEAYIVYGTLTPPSSISMASLGSAGVTINGLAASSNLGWSMGSFNDINGDGLADIAIGAPNDSVGGSNAGAVFVIYGSKSLASSIDVKSIIASNGIVFRGLSANDKFGETVGSAGDYNGDGLKDIFFKYANTPTIVFGSKSFNNPYSSPFLKTNIDGDNGFIMPGITSEGTPETMSSAKDIDGDGLDDLLIGYEANDEAYILYGHL